MIDEKGNKIKTKSADSHGEAILRIDSLAFGGDGVGRLGGKVCFVPLACPGDLLRVRIAEEREGYLRAQIAEVLEAGRDRREPQCPSFGRCGGCHWQHVDYPAQLAAKRELLAEALKRIAHIETVILPVVPSTTSYGYRTRARLHVAGGGGLGYFARASNEVVPVAQCPILAPELESRLAARAGRLQEPHDPRGLREPRESEEPQKRREPHAPAPPFGAAGTAGRGFSPQEIELSLAPDGTVRERIVHLEPPRRGSAARRSDRREEAYSFHQVNPHVNAALVRSVFEAVEREARGSRPLAVLDLYCGDGNLSLPVAPLANRVIGVDSSEESIREAAEGARAAGFSHAHYSRGDVSSALDEEIARRTGTPYGSNGRASSPAGLVPGRSLGGGSSSVGSSLHGSTPAELLCIIADPPRAGLRDVAAKIAELAPALFIYISCNPPALARDARLLADAGLALELAEPFDMFPQTYHLETLALFKQGASPAAPRS